MNWNQIEGNWKQIQGTITEKWAKLTNVDMDEIKGKRDKLLGMLQERYGVAEEEANRWIDEWQKELEASKKDETPTSR